MDPAIALYGSGILVAAASGLVGAFLILRRMTLLSDALSHVALPGIAIGLLLHVEPLAGGLAFLFFGILLIWGIEEKTALAVESITGVLFVTALAAGTALMPQTDLLEAFFGNVESITVSGAIVQSALAFIVILLALQFTKPLVLSAIAPDLATSVRVPRRAMELLLLALIAVTITIGVSFVGVLLMSGLCIIPAACARNLAKTFRSFLALSVAIAVLSLLAGLLAHTFFAGSVGTTTVFVSAGLFVISLLTKFAK